MAHENESWPVYLAKTLPVALLGLVVGVAIPLVLLFLYYLFF